jgi:hypothetical protein
MNENKKSFYPSDMSEFIHLPEYGCCDLKGLTNALHATLILFQAFKPFLPINFGRLKYLVLGAHLLPL